MLVVVEDAQLIASRGRKRAMDWGSGRNDISGSVRKDAVRCKKQVNGRKVRDVRRDSTVSQRQLQGNASRMRREMGRLGYSQFCFFFCVWISLRKRSCAGFYSAKEERKMKSGHLVVATRSQVGGASW